VAKLHGRQRRQQKLLIIVAAVVLLVVLSGWYLARQPIPVLQARGPIGNQERQLMKLGAILSVIVVLPVYAMTVAIVLKYREGNQKAKKYRPDWDHSRLFESIWWGIPIVIIGFLSLVAWNSAHSLDPYKAQPLSRAPINIEVVAMDWKWLFIYPQQNIASVNLLQIPTNTPIDFKITSDTVMNSFWIPQLSGQIYAMPGMTTQLHLSADKPGSYYGSPANISGSGFSTMTFTVKATSQADFNNWLSHAKMSDMPLNNATYAQLAKPSKDQPVSYYSAVQKGLFDDLVMKYMMPASSAPTEHTMPDGTTMPGGSM
jgi:cytochrome o ubiquinol oxidase subunit 2